MKTTLWAGAGVAMAAGLLLGAAMKPDLTADGRPGGPQILNQASGRASGPFDDGASYASYAGPTPDYVLGTDWKRLAYQASAAAAPEMARLRDESRAPPEPRPEPQPALDARELTPAVYRSASADPAGAPVPASDDAYDDASRAEKTPAVAPVDGEDEAPPSATGDTRRTR